MTIIEDVHLTPAAVSHHPAFRIDTITLTWDERRRGHGRRRSDSGLEFAISLPSGTVLKAGDCFVLVPDNAIVAVREAAEPVYVIQPKTPQEWAYYAYQVGNRHQTVMIEESELVFLQNPAVRSLLDQLHVPYTAGQRPFTGALGNIGHSHE